MIREAAMPPEAAVASTALRIGGTGSLFTSGTASSSFPYLRLERRWSDVESSLILSIQWIQYSFSAQLLPKFWAEGSL